MSEEKHKIYSEIEMQASTWLKETDTFQFSQMELLTMFAEAYLKQWLKENIPSDSEINEMYPISYRVGFRNLKKKLLNKVK